MYLTNPTPEPENDDQRDRLESLERSALCEDQDALDQLGELMERWEDRLTLQNVALAERYEDGRLNLLIELSWAAMDLYAVIQRVDAPGPSWHPAELPHHHADLNFSAGEKADWHSGLGGHVVRCSRSWDDAIVFVENVQSVQVVQRCIPSRITLQSSDALARMGADAVYFSHGTGFHKLSGLVQGKPAVRPWGFTIRSDQVADQEVEGATKVVDCIANHSAEVGWDRLLLNDAKDALAGLRIVLNEHFIRGGFEEPPDSRLKIKDVMFGPFQF